MKKYDTIVLIGRFQPLHNAHLELARKASKLADQLIVIVGSAKQPSTFKNPWSYQERKEMIRQAIDVELDESRMDLEELVIEPNIDTIYNNGAWASRVHEIVARHTNKGDKIGIIGHDKDLTSFYLNMFPQWGREEIDLIEPLNATEIRNLYFRRDANPGYIAGVIPETTQKFLEAWAKTERFEKIVQGREFVAKYKKQYASLPYAPTFVTTDAVVFQSGHVLLVKRKAEPGQGLWALPGGFLNANTDASMQDCMIRELKEETGIKVPVPVLVGNIKDMHIFDAIDRSERGRTIDHAFKIVLPDGPLPKVKGMDDAEVARWVPLGELDSETMFEDHHEIIYYFLGTV